MSGEERPTRKVKLGTAVIGADGHHIGDIDGVVLDPLNDRVQTIILRKGLIFHSDQSFSARSVTGVDEHGVHVSFTRDDANTMDHWMDADYLRPPDGYFGAMDGVFWPRETYRGAMNVEEQSMEIADDHLGMQQPLLELVHGAEVVDSDGEGVGKVVDLATDPAGRITAFRVDQGRIRHHERWVPIHFVTHADDERVTLGTTLANLDARLEEQGTTDPGDGFVLDLDDWHM